jgi:hypothetical protein
MSLSNLFWISLPDDIILNICEDHLYQDEKTLFNLMMTNHNNCRVVIRVFYKYKKYHDNNIKYLLMLLYNELSEDDRKYIDENVTKYEDLIDDKIEIKRLNWDKGKKNIFKYSSMIKVINVYSIYKYLFKDIHATRIFMNLLFKNNDKLYIFLNGERDEMRNLSLYIKNRISKIAYIHIFFKIRNYEFYLDSFKSHVTKKRNFFGIEPYLICDINNSNLQICALYNFRDDYHIVKLIKK